MKYTIFLKSLIVSSLLVFATIANSLPIAEKARAGIELELKDPKFEPTSDYERCMAVSGKSMPKLCDGMAGDDQDNRDDKGYLPRK